tara:strand:- start:345 stop:683 length:339 start_codon:yes stop_codon:yes gene_type:complete
MNSFSIFVFLIIAVCFLLVLVIMVQNPKGGGLSSSFGGDTQQIGGVKKTTDFLDNSTWVLASLLLVLILLSNITIERVNGPVDSKLLNPNQTEIEIPEQIDQEIPIEIPIED